VTGGGGDGLDRLFSADSHVVEPPECYRDAFPRAARDRAPYVERRDEGDRWVFPGSTVESGTGLMANAGQDPHAERVDGRLDAVPSAAHDPDARIDAQDRDGVVAELLFPTVTLLALQHPDPDVRGWCCDAYNAWLAAFCARHPDRLLGAAVSAAGTPEQTADDITAAARAGFRAVLLPARPGGDVDYDDPAFDGAWSTAAGAGLPVCFHVHTVRAPRRRGSPLAIYTTMIRSCQDALATLVLGGVLARHPDLRVLLVEADAGWLPHFVQRMDHAWERHRHALGETRLRRRPSEAVGASVYATFQDDDVALRSLHLLDPERLLWANDYPHADSTWPRSRETLRVAMRDVAVADRRRIVHDNAAALFGSPGPRSGP
jgi:predicted TIM-barrel fold metal-dependent hydrolase